MSHSEMSIGGVRISLDQQGEGPPLLFLDSGMRFEALSSAALDVLARDFTVYRPSHPGFGSSDRAVEMTSVDDLSYFYLDFLAEQDLTGVTIVGASFGAWIAAMMAVKCTARISHLVLINPVGIKISDRETRDVVDIFSMTEEDVRKAIFHSPPDSPITYSSMDDALLAARCREALARYAWAPYMHDPKLKGRLHRIDVPTLVLRGVSDGLTQQPYSEAFAAAVPAAQFGLIDKAGHLPHLEQPERFAEAVGNFVLERNGVRAASGAH